MLNRALKAFGKSLLIVTGVGYGVVKALEILPATPSGEGRADNAPPAAKQVDLRLDLIEQRILRLESAQADHPPFVTRAELESELEYRLAAQHEAVQSLRAMVARTDELLEQVIENIESMGVGA